MVSGDRVGMTDGKLHVAEAVEILDPWIAFQVALRVLQLIPAVRVRIRERWRLTLLAHHVAAQAVLDV